MTEIKFRFKRDAGTGEWDMFILNRKELLYTLTNDLPDDISEHEIAFDLEEQKKPSNNFLAFYNGTVKPYCSKGFIDLGYYEMNEDATDLYLRRKFGNGKTLNKMLPEERKHFMEVCIIFAAQELHIIIKTPDEYKQEKEFWRMVN